MNKSQATATLYLRYHKSRPNLPQHHRQHQHQQQHKKLYINICKNQVLSTEFPNLQLSNLLFPMSSQNCILKVIQS